MRYVESAADGAASGEVGQTEDRLRPTPLGRRDFLAMSAAPVAMPALGARAAAAAGADGPAAIPAAASKSNCQQVVVGPQIPVITNLKQNLSVDLDAIRFNVNYLILTHLLGGHGFITHLATVWPEHELGIWALAQAGNYRAAMDRHSTDDYAWGAVIIVVAGPVVVGIPDRQRSGFEVALPQALVTMQS